MPAHLRSIENFLAAYAAVHSTPRIERCSLRFLAAYAAVHLIRTYSGLLPVFLAAYAAVHGDIAKAQAPRANIT